MLSALSSEVFAVGADETRLLGFAEHQKNGKQFDKARVQGERGYLEGAEQWEEQRHRELEGYKKSKKAKLMNDDGPEAHADEVAKKALNAEYEQTRLAWIAKKNQEDRMSRADKNLPTEAQELGLDMERPRYEYRKRAAFGAKPKFGSAVSAGSSGSSGHSGGTSFPPPPTFDDFSGGGSGYVPAPNMDDFGDVPPPPPPPPPGFGDDFGGGYGNDFTPPPPPPPPFGDDGDF